ncbi:MAG: type II toxin-antitoxin system RelE/ParE family toxin [Candidatus Xenobiia bacterium LiM19]
MRLDFPESVKKQLRKLDKAVRRQIGHELNRLLAVPASVDLKKIKTRKNEHRLAVGDYRVILEIDREQRVISVLQVKARKDAYRDL